MKPLQPTRRVPGSCPRNPATATMILVPVHPVPLRPPELMAAEPVMATPLSDAAVASEVAP